MLSTHLIIPNYNDLKRDYLNSSLLHARWLQRNMLNYLGAIIPKNAPVKKLTTLTCNGFGPSKSDPRTKTFYFTGSNSSKL